MVAFNPQGSTAALNSAGYADTPAGRDSYTQDTGATAYPDAASATFDSSGRVVSNGSSSGGGGGSNGDSASGGLQALLNALASGNAASAQEAIRQFNLNFGLDTNKFNEAVKEYNQNFGLAQSKQSNDQALAVAGLTGYYNAPGANAPSAAPLNYPAGTVVRTNSNQFGVVGPNGIVTPGDASNPAIYAAIQAGQGIMTVDDSAFSGAQQQSAGAAGSGGTQTLAGAAQQAALSGQYNGAPTESAREFNTTAAQLALNQSNQTGLGVLNLASSLHSDPFRQLQVMYGANQIDGVNKAVQGLTGQYGLATPQSGGAGANSANLGGLAQEYNNAGSGQTPQQMANNTGLYNPNQIIAREYNNAPQNVQDYATSALSANTGLDQASINKQIQKNLPQFNAPSFGLATI